MNHTDYIEKRLKQLSQPYICPFCGKKECNNIWHIIKLSTLPRTYMKPKHYTYMYGMLALLAVVVAAIYWLTVKLLN